MAEILKGADVASAINEKLIQRVEALRQRGVAPTLAIVRIGERADDIAYEKGAAARCEKIGVEVRRAAFPADIPQEALTETIRSLNGDASVHGVLLLRPLPEHMDENAVCNILAPEKDVDGITSASMAGVFTGEGSGYPPCTARALMEILEHYGIELKGKRAVIIGRSLVVGKPAAMMLLGKHATVTICHTRTKDMPDVCREAEILIAAAGRAKMVDRNYVSPGQVVLDVGINADGEGSICGDVDFGQAEPVVKAITPVPGGVGTVTTSVLAKHVVEAAELASGLKGQVS